MPIRCEKRWHLYAALQMRFSVRLLYDFFETDAEYRGRYGVLLKRSPTTAAPLSSKKRPFCVRAIFHAAIPHTSRGGRFRSSPCRGVNEPNFLKPIRNEENPAFYPPRDFGNAVHSLCLGGEADESVRGALHSVMDAIDYENHTSGGPLDLLGGYRTVEKACFCDKKCEK